MKLLTNKQIHWFYRNEIKRGDFIKINGTFTIYEKPEISSRKETIFRNEVFLVELVGRDRHFFTCRYCIKHSYIICYMEKNEILYRPPFERNFLYFFCFIPIILHNLIKNVSN